MAYILSYKDQAWLLPPALEVSLSPNFGQSNKVHFDLP